MGENTFFFDNYNHEYSEYPLLVIIPFETIYCYWKLFGITLSNNDRITSINRKNELEVSLFIKNNSYKSVNLI